MMLLLSSIGRVQQYDLFGLDAANMSEVPPTLYERHNVKKGGWGSISAYIK